MTQIYRFLLCLAAALCVGAHAIDDPYNSYIWNRANALAGKGAVDGGDWYEWWYYKVIDPETERAYFFTYGVVNPWDTSGQVATNSAIVQAGDFKSRILISQRFPMSVFEASYDQSRVTVADNRATDSRIQGHLTADGHDIAWDLTIKKVWGFNAMGWTMHVPEISNIYWYPAQAAATMSGWLRTDGHTVRLEAAPAYQDRNWGRSFPKWWTWLTANGFKNSPDTVLAAGGGEPKVLNSVYANGSFGIGLKYQGQEYTFRSADLAKFDFQIQWGKWSLIAENRRGQRIEISATAPSTSFFDIPFYTPQGSDFHDYEALLGHMTVKLLHRDFVPWAWRTIAELETDHAGVEWGSPDAINAMGLMNIHKLLNTQVPLR